MEILQVQAAKTADEARQYAIEWQTWSSEQALSYGELAQWQNVFAALADRFNLKDEFMEDGIV